MPRRLVRVMVMLILTITLFTPALASSMTAETAPGGPGANSVWSPGDKEWMGSSVNTQSKVWFTGTDGIITEVFYPTLDTANVQDLQFMVGDADHTWVDEEKSQTHTVKQVDPKALMWEVTSEDRDQRWRLTKKIFTDPTQHTLIQRVTFQALAGNVNDYNLYVLHNPSMNNSGANNHAKTIAHQNRTMLVASKQDKVSALGLSLPWKNNQVSNAFVGVNDGWQDLLGGQNPDYEMTYTYDAAYNGNVAQMGMVDMGNGNETSVSFDLVLGFGANENEALQATTASLNQVSAAETNYITEWHTYTNDLDSQGGAADDQYYLATMLLKASQDKTYGGIVAGLGNPWGDSVSADEGKHGGYHLVWARDLYKFANSLIVAGDTQTANRAVDFLFHTQMDQQTGRFPQNSWNDGTPYWNATQMDEQGMPIILAWKLKRQDLWPKVQKTADYIVNTGPWTQQERWEENAGFSPATIAAQIAGLVCAADMAKQNGDLNRANTYLSKADEWQAKVNEWTFTTSGVYGDGQYYLRIDENGNPNDGQTIHIANGGGSYDERAIVDMSFLELVRMGVKKPTDPHITKSLAVVDAVIKQSIPGKGDAWFRYNHDGYGEKADGSNYTGAGVGRLWPIFTAERGIYEIANGNSGDAYLATLKKFSSSTGTLPEQVWDLNAPSGKAPGTPTGSMQALNWSMGEYINLLASIHQGKPVGIPSVVQERYESNDPPPHDTTPHSGYQVDYDSKLLKRGQELKVYYKGALQNESNLILHWGNNEWHDVTQTSMRKRSDGFWEAAIQIPTDANQLNFVFWNGNQSWDNNKGRDWYLPVYTDQNPVLINPAPQANKTTTITYRGELAPSSRSITLHWGVSGWQQTQNTSMTPNRDGSWSATITLPSNSYSINMAFKNQSNQWDNRNGLEYSYTVTQ
ncbi:hypothetical protein IC619_015595 [Hazenella sp. IB182353]|uniref:glycoside hydrolase family 15 protein n=1 Tax=Polycladospora coralii TaxID=2771432 RepID=UPI001745DF43|nr:glycoside hydrolase family 15 protein [Polycladospora coralii]MBS7531896.1 hypothetical protein [Polycladospora coralii]